MSIPNTIAPAASGALAPLAAASAETSSKPSVSVVLVHGAFADGSSWGKVIPRLRAKELDVVAVQNPLTPLADDAAFTRRATEKALIAVTVPMLTRPDAVAEMIIAAAESIPATP